MGLGMPYIQYMSRKGFFSGAKPKVLDIGSQNLLAASPEDIETFAIKHGYQGSLEALREEAKRISYFSFPRAGERTSYISELFDLTNIFYHSYDICPALKTEIFELNFQSLPMNLKNQFDVVMNFGTTEHILNQYNVFKVMHEATRSGGIMFHQIPSMGWLNHGYFCYHQLFFDDLAKCNQYEIADIWLNSAGVSSLDMYDLDIRCGSRPHPEDNQSAKSNKQIENFNINVVFLKSQDNEFKIPLELQTSHSAPDPKFSVVMGL